MTKGLKKMFEKRGGSKPKKSFPGPVHVVTNDELSPRKKPLYTEGQKRRAHQVGRVLYDNIVQIVNSGELSTQLAAMSVEIVQAKVVPNFSSVNVYWLSSGSKDDDERMEMLLREHEGLLRQLLTSKHVLGTIPRINFVRDDSRAHYLHVESLLSKADFGPDFVPTTLDTSIRDNIILSINVKDPSPVSKLQAQFDQVSNLNKAEIAEHWLSAQPNLNERHSATVKEERVLAQKSGDVDKIESSECNQSHELSSTSRQPSSLEVEQLCNQFLPNNKEISSGSFTAWNVANMQTSNMNVNSDGLSPHKEPVSKDFRDDLYGVPYSELFNKILIKRQKGRTQPKGYSGEARLEIPIPTGKSNGMKTVLQKKAKTKGKLSLQSDYYSVGFPLHGASENDESALEDEENSDEER